MSAVINFLHFSAFAMPVATLLYLWYRRRGIEIDHIFVFSVGFIFYSVLPFTLAKSFYFSVYDSYSAWIHAFNLVTRQTWALYFSSLLLWYGSFVAGSWIGGKHPLTEVEKKNPVEPMALNIFFAAAIFFVFLFGYQLRSYFFWSYQKSTQIPVFGSFVAASIFLMSVAVCAMAYRHYKSKGKQALWKLLIHPAVISYCIVAVLLVSMGGRVVVVSSLLMGVVFFSVYIRRLRVFSVIAIFIVLILSSHIIVLWRIGYRSEIFNPKHLYQYYNVQEIGIKLVPETFNVSYSLVDFLGKYSIPVIRFPTVLLSRLIGLIPSFIFPAKTAWFVDFSSLGYSIGNLSGGFNMYVSLVVNFGIVGASFFLFGLSYALQRLKRHASPIAIAIYIMVSGWLAAEFFRDFEQTITKEMLEFSVLMPIALLALSYIIMKRRKAKTNV